MKYFLPFAIVLGLGWSACSFSSENCPTVEITGPEGEISQMRNYLQAHQIKAQEDKRGFFYSIDQEGDGAYPTACANVTVDYTGRLTDGTVFDQNEKITFDLANLVDGWKEGLPLVREGGIITLYIPPTLAYGARGSGPVPPNAAIIFTIKLHKINH